MSALELQDVRVVVGAGRHTLAAVDGVTLTVPAGQVVGLVGESGSGKSTLGRAAVGLVPLAAGRVLRGGRDAARVRGGACRPVQMVFQDPRGSLDPRMTIGDSIGEALGARRRLSRRTARAETARWLELVGLDPASAQLLPRALSGGQRQRVGLARALAAEPEVIVADEITSALDVSVQGSVLNVLRELQRELGFGMLFISHNLAVVRYVSDAVAVMHLGRIVEAGTPQEVIGAPLHPYTRRLLETIPRLGGSLEDAGGDVVASAEDAARLGAPAGGCRYRARCPIGPVTHPERRDCVEQDPQTDAAQRPHRAACHHIEQPGERRAD